MKKKWNERDLTTALTLYKANKEVKMNTLQISSASTMLGCTPSSLKMCFMNFKYIETDGKSGLAHYSRAQKEVFNKFYYILP
jgi:hypothetical protein